MKHLLIVLLLCISLEGCSQISERVKQVDSLIQSNKFKSIRLLTKRSIENTTYYGFSRQHADVWVAVEQSSKRRGAATDQSIRYCFLLDELLAIEIWSREAECTKCKSTYYFQNNELIYKKEDTAPQYNPVLLQNAATHLKTISRYAYRST
jgi:hypothetical protein